MKDQTFLKQPATVTGKNRNTPNPPYPKLSAIIEKGRSDVPIYGIYCWGIDYPVYREAIQKIGYRNIRTGGTGFTDEMFRMINEDGLAVVMTRGLRYSPDQYESDEAWVQANIDSTLELLGKYGPNGSYFKEHPEVPYTPLTAVELFNKPNFGYMIPDRSPIDRKVELYCKLQVAEYKAIKERYPEVKVVGFGAGGASAADMGFVFKCIQKEPEMVNTMDVFSTHPYVDPHPPFAYVSWLPDHCIATAHKKLRAALDGRGKQDMPIWYTELGWMIPPSEGGHFNTCQHGVNLLEHAAYNVQVYILGLRLGVERITTMYIMDTDNCNPGIVNRDGSWRPAAHAVKLLIDIMPDPRLIGAIHDGDDYNSHAYVFESCPGGEEVTVAFTSRLPQTMDIPWDAPQARLTDMLGHEQIVDVKDGILTIEAGIYPIYIRNV